MAIIDMKQIKLRRRFYLLCIVIVIGFIWGYNFFKIKSYIKEYKINDVLVKEKYDKNLKSYVYQFIYNDEDYVFALTKDYSWKRKLVKKIDVLANDDETCLLVKSNEINFYPLCRDKNEQIAYLLVSDKMKENFSFWPSISYSDEVNYNDITIYNYFYHNYYIWNYRGFDYLNTTSNTKIELFDKDVYNPKLIVQTDDYLLVPDYNTNYYFNKVYIINALNGKVSSWDLSKDVYFDSMVLGIIGNEIYLLDKHENVEWKIDVAKKKMTNVGTLSKKGLFYDNEWQKLSLNKIIEKKEFKGLKAMDFVNENGLKAIIMDKTVKIKNADVKIIRKTNESVYYLVDDVLYEYSFGNGEIKLLSKFEWNFNNQNTIFIF